MKQVVTHGWSLVAGTSRTWVRFLPWLLGFTLFAWAGEYGCLLVSGVVATYQPYLVIFGLSVGLTIQLLMIVLALRKVGDLTHWSSSEPVSVRRIIDVALLPFLGIYVAFGYVNDYVSNLIFLIQGRTDTFTLANILGELNPTGSRTRLIVVLASLVVLYVLGQVLGSIRSKTASVWLDLASTLVTAFGTFLGILSIFRIWEQVRLWLYTRNVWGWIGTFSDWLRETFPIDVPEFLSQAWAFLADTCWPGFWDLLVQPLVWFALAILVAGGQFIHVDDIVTRVVPPSSNKFVNFLREDVQERILGDLDVKVLPVLHALRRMWKATVPFLAAYIVVFTVLTWIGEGLESFVWRLMGMQSTVSVIVNAIPLVDAISSVLIMSLKIALLVVTFSQAEKLAESPPAPRTSVGTTVLIVALCFILAVAHTLTAPSMTTTRSGREGQTLTIMGVQVSISDVRVGTRLESGWHEDVTDQRFVAVHLTAYSKSVQGSLNSTLVGSGHTYDPYDFTYSTHLDAGFLSEIDLVFEVSTADCSRPLYFETRSIRALTAQIEVARFRLDLNLAGSEGSTVSADMIVEMSVP